MSTNEVERQVRKAAQYFAHALQSKEAGAKEAIPDWLSLKAQLWIQKRHETFTDMVLEEYRLLLGRIEEAKSRRPMFALPDVTGITPAEEGSR